VVMSLRRAALALLAVAASARTLHARHSGGERPHLSLHALRGGAAGDGLPQLLWVRRAENGTSALLVRSLTAFCEKHDLDEDEMLAVSRGESDAHKGWECGEVEEYDPPEPEEEAGTDENETIEAEAADNDGAMDDDGATDGTSPSPMHPAPQKNKMIIGIVGPMLATQLMKRFDHESPSFIPGLRIFYFACVGFNVMVQFVLQWMIRATNDSTIVNTPLNPLAMLMGGSNNPNDKKTAAEYDAAQLKSLRSSYQMGCLFTLFLHFKMKMTQPLVYSSVSGLIDLFYNPLVQIHLLHRPAEGHYKRPFGSGSPGIGSLFNASAAGPPGKGGGLAELLGGLAGAQ